MLNVFFLVLFISIIDRYRTLKLTLRRFFSKMVMGDGSLQIKQVTFSKCGTLNVNINDCPMFCMYSIISGYYLRW